MVRKKGKGKLIAALAVLLVLLIAIATVALMQLNNKDEADSNRERNTSSQQTVNDTPSKEDEAENETPEVETKTKDPEEPILDPTTVATVDIEPMSLIVSYVKRAGSFEYQVLRTANGTQYVEFSNPELVGTKCTNDKGTFASILASPEETDSSTLAKKTTVESTTYGLSLEPATCTSDADKLQTYQKSFSDAFSLLKKMD